MNDLAPTQAILRIFDGICGTRNMGSFKNAKAQKSQEVRVQNLGKPIFQAFISQLQKLRI